MPQGGRQLMELFDTHFHFYGETSPVEFMNNVRASLAVPPQCEPGTVDRLELLACGADYLESRRAMEFAQVIPDAWFAAGVHPHQAGDHLESPADFSEFRAHPRLAAVGELGLDYFYDHSERTLQRRVLEVFLGLALEWNRPAIIHLRDRDGSDDAYRDAAALLTPFAAAGGRFVIHCFAGTPAWAERFLELGACCGVTGMVTFRRADNIREVLRVIPDDRLLIETDSPYLAPVPHRGEQNHPGYLILIAARIAAERGVPVDRIAALTTANARRFFRIPEPVPAEELS